MFCDNCGSNLRDGAVFCPKCGAAVKVDVESSESSNDSPVSDNKDGYAGTQTNENENNKPLSDDLNRKKKKLIIIVIVAVVLFLAIAIGVVIIVVNNAKFAPNNNELLTVENNTGTKMTETTAEAARNNGTELTQVPTDHPVTVLKQRKSMRR